MKDKRLQIFLKASAIKGILYFLKINTHRNIQYRMSAKEGIHFPTCIKSKEVAQ